MWDLFYGFYLFVDETFNYLLNHFWFELFVRNNPLKGLINRGEKRNTKPGSRRGRRPVNQVRRLKSLPERPVSLSFPRWETKLPSGLTRIDTSSFSPILRFFVLFLVESSVPWSFSLGTLSLLSPFERLSSLSFYPYGIKTHTWLFSSRVGTRQVYTLSGFRRIVTENFELTETLRGVPSILSWRSNLDWSN